MLFRSVLREAEYELCGGATVGEVSEEKGGPACLDRSSRRGDSTVGGAQGRVRTCTSMHGTQFGAQGTQGVTPLCATPTAM